MVRNVTRVSGWGVSRNLQQGPFTPDHVVLARLLTPHIRRALEIVALIDQSATGTTTLRALLDAMTCAALVVDAEARVIHVNRLAEAEMEHGRVLRLRRNRVSSPIDSVARLIAALGRRTGLRGDDLEVDDPEDGRVQVSWTRLDQDDRYLVLARKPAAELVTPLGTAVRLFALTAAETQVLAALLHGRNLDEAAEWLGLSRSTIKTHLDSIFTKTGERRQPDLIRRVIGLKTPVG